MSELATTNGGGTLATSKTHEILKVNFDNPESLPDLNQEVVESPVSLSASYWTPENVGEEKKVFFAGFQTDMVQSLQSQEFTELEVAVFVEQVEDKGKKTIVKIINGSKRLVGILESSMKSGAIEVGSAICVKYLGKKKNKTNNFQSDSWDVKVLMKKLEPKAEA